MNARTGIAAVAGLLATAAPLPGASAATALKATVLVSPGRGAGEDASVAARVRQMIMARLAARGFDVREALPPSDGSRPRVKLVIRAGMRVIPGAYTRRAVLSLEAVLRDADTGRYLARVGSGPEMTWRVAAGCRRACLEDAAFRTAAARVDGLAADIARALSRLRTAPPSRTFVFEGFDTALAPEIERYLRVFPGVSDLQRVPSVGRRVVYRYRYRRDGSAADMDASLRRMMDQLRLGARIARTASGFTVRADGSRDW